MCDNSSSVDLLTNYRARTWASGVVLGAIDVLLATNDIDAKFEWIATDLNRLSDWLSRKRLQEFRDRVRQEHGNSVRMVELQVPTHRMSSENYLDFLSRHCFENFVFCSTLIDQNLNCPSHTIFSHG